MVVMPTAGRRCPLSTACWCGGGNLEVVAVTRRKVRSCWAAKVVSTVLRELHCMYLWMRHAWGVSPSKCRATQSDSHDAVSNIYVFNY